MAEVIYYFNARGDVVWTDPDNIVDNNLGTFGYTSTNGAAQVLNGNTCPGTDLGTITKVELRLYGYGDGDDRIDITPIFSAGDGDTHQTTPAIEAGWGSYVDITNDTNHPDWSLWSHIQTIDCKLAFAKVAKGNTVYCAKVEIRVTYYTLDVGADPIDRATNAGSGFTRIDKNNPANASGTLHSVKVYAYENISGLRVGTFHWIGGTNYKCRDSELIGDVEAGAERTFTELSITVREGDYIGCYFTAGKLEYDTSGFSGIFYISGEYIDPGDETVYSSLDGHAISLYCYGDIEAVPPPDIDVGADAIMRTGAYSAGATLIDKYNPANASGIITDIEIFPGSSMTGLIVGTFYTTNGNTLKCRDSVIIGDVINGGVRHSFSGLSISVEQGDYIGCYYASGSLDYDDEVGVGLWHLSGEHIDPGDEATYIFDSGRTISLYGYGDIVGVPENTVYLVKATGKRTQLSAGAVAIRIDPATGRRGLQTTFSKFLVREDDGTLRAKSA